jgi:hypothetical protein
VLLAWTLGGGLDYLDGIWHSLTSNTLYIGVEANIKPLIISLTSVPTVVLLKPNFASKTKVRYKLNGKSISVPITITPQLN